MRAECSVRSTHTPTTNVMFSLADGFALLMAVMDNLPYYAAQYGRSQVGISSREKGHW